VSWFTDFFVSSLPQRTRSKKSRRERFRFRADIHPHRSANRIVPPPPTQPLVSAVQHIVSGKLREDGHINDSRSSGAQECRMVDVAIDVVDGARSWHRVPLGGSSETAKRLALFCGAKCR